MDELVRNTYLLTTDSYQTEFIKLVGKHTRGEKMTSTQKDQLVAHSWAIAHALDSTCL